MEWCDEGMESEQEGVRKKGVERCYEGMGSEQGGASKREWSGVM